MANTLKDLFQNKIISEGPNAGKTAEQAYAVRNSKDLPIQSSNWFLKEINKNTTGGIAGKVINTFDFIEKINDRRKRYSIKDGEAFIEQDQVGLRQFGITSRPLLYGGDIFRISNGRTRTLSFIKRAANQNIGGGLDDKIAGAIGDFAGDYVNNLFSGKKGKDAIPPKPDLVAFGTELAVDIADRTLGALLPVAMVPSKVAEELDKKGKKEQTAIAATGGTDKKFNLLYGHEFNRQKAIIELANSKKVPGFIKGLLKNNTNALQQSKDVLMSTASSVVRGAIKAGAAKLIRAGVDAVSKKKRNQLLGGITPLTGNTVTPWSSANQYSKRVEYDEFQTLDKNTGVKAQGFRKKIEYLKTLGVAIPASSIAFSTPLNGNPGPDDTIEEGSVDTKADVDLMKKLNEEPLSDYNNNPNSQYLRRGMSSKQDILNITEDNPYIGEHANLPDGKAFDDFDFIPMKFYSIAQDRTVQFRCTVEELSETFTPNWEPNKFIGNPFNFYTYQGIERSLTIGFKVFSLNLVEHQNAWERLSFLGKLTMPQEFKGLVGAVTPPIMKFTLGNMYVKKDAIIESLTFSIDADTPWEIGLNRKAIVDPIQFSKVIGSMAIVDPERDAKGFKLPMIIKVDAQIKFLESRQTVEGVPIYGYSFAPTEKAASGQNG